MARQTTLFKGQKIEVADTKRIVKRAEYEAVRGKQPCFGMDKRELFVLRRETKRNLATQRRKAEIEKTHDEGETKTMGKSLVLRGQTIACAVSAEDVAEGFVNISLSGIDKWRGMCHYFCVSINETHESFWWRIDDLYEGLVGAESDEDGILVWLLGADEYHRPSHVPLGWPWGKSPVDNWPIAYMDLPGRVCITEGGLYVRPHWSAWGNLHPSGGESGEYFYVK
jgi:hypothetical protein